MTAAQLKQERQSADMPAIVLIGHEEGDRPRGSWFGREDSAAAKKAAGLSGMRVVAIRSGVLRELALRVPKGRIFSSGKVFAPRIQPTVYDALLPHAGAVSKLKLVAQDNSDNPKTAATDAGKARKGEGEMGNGGNAKEVLPPDWARINVGCTVLAYSPEDESWFDSIVTEARPNSLFVLKWRDYPDDPSFQRRRHQLALRFPEGNAATA